jgi:Tfp pilus assembly protein PilX
MVPQLESQHSNLRHGDGPLALAQAGYLLLVVVVVEVVCTLLAAIVAVLRFGVWVV